MKLKLLVPLVVVIAAGGVSYAAAATLGVGSNALGAGRIDVPPCDSDGFTFTRTLDSSHNIATVTVSGISSACAGGTLYLTLANGSNAALGSGTGSVTSSGYVTVTINGTAAAASVNSYHVAIAS